MKKKTQEKVPDKTRDKALQATDNLCKKYPKLEKEIHEVASSNRVWGSDMALGVAIDTLRKLRYDLFGPEIG